MEEKISVKYHIQRKGFTLAEVLITLGIIGVVAAMTIPPLSSHIQTEQFRVGLKKVYSTLTQAVNTIYAQNGSIDTSTVDNLIADLGTQIKMQKVGQWGDITTLPTPFNYHCYKETGGTCGNFMSRPGNDGDKAFITNDGVLFRIWGNTPNCDLNNWHAEINPSEVLPLKNACAYFEVDLNGDKNPNQIGMDAHEFILLKENNNYYVRPAGANTNTICLTGYPETYNNSINCTARMLMDMPMP